MFGSRKHRGLKRYYRNLALKNDFENTDELEFNDPSTWPYGCHWHFDWRGYGNHNFKKRKPHLDKLFRHFDLVAAQTKNLKTDFHLYIILLDYHSQSDALYLNKPYLTNSPLRFKFSDLLLSSTLTNKLLNDYIDHLPGFEKRYGKSDEAFCLIYKKDVGQPLQD